MFSGKSVILPAPIGLFCYHKGGTVLLRKVFVSLCKEFGWSFDALRGFQSNFPDELDIALFGHSLIYPERISRVFRGLHLVRDPRDIIVSGYLYHSKEIGRAHV